MAAPQTIEAHRAQWIDAFNRHDLDAHMALYAEEATLFGSTDTLQVGREMIRAYFGARGPNVRVHRYHEPQITPFGPDMATSAAHVDFADGDAMMPYRVTWTLIRRNGGWVIAQHHGSPRRG